MKENKEMSNLTDDLGEQLTCDREAKFPVHLETTSTCDS